MLKFAAMVPEHIDRAYAIESASYPADEAASLEGLRFRESNSMRVNK
jgi:hypothetical protein